MVSFAYAQFTSTSRLPNVLLDIFSLRSEMSSSFVTSAVNECIPVPVRWSRGSWAKRVVKTLNPTMFNVRYRTVTGAKRAPYHET